MPAVEHPPPVRARDDAYWTPLLAGLHSDTVDCLQTTVSLLADAAHGPGTHLALGTRYGLTWRLDGETGAEPTVDVRLAEADDLLGLRVEERWAGVDGPRLRRLAAETGPLYVVGDAYHLPWGPYAGQQHLAHSFLLLGGGHPKLPGGGPPKLLGGGHLDQVTVVDAYHNDTPWGPARPGVFELSPARFDAALATGLATNVATGPVAVRLAVGPLPPVVAAVALAHNAARLRAAVPGIERYLATLRAGLSTLDGVERLVLDVWLLDRERSLHAGWLAAAGSPVARVAQVVGQAREWHRLAAQTYLGLRRARRGQPAAPALVDQLAVLLDRDVALAQELAAGADAVAAPVRAAVLDALRSTLDLDDDSLRAARTLRDLPGFNSFRLVDVIDRVERSLGVELAADGIAAADLRDVDGLCQAFASAREPA